MRAIDTEGLDEQIRCEMCRNPMRTDRGCDGNCQYDEKLHERIMQMLDERIKPLPSAQPEPKWIPCSETVDIPDHEILACDKYGKEMFGYLSYEDEQWLCESDGYMMYDPIAWREKPEPYREEGD